MIFLVALTAGTLAAAGVWLILQRNLIRITLGFAMLSNAGNLILISASGSPLGKTDAVAQHAATGELLNVGGYVDPLPQALILTAIVISFAVTAFQIVLVYVHNRDTGKVATDMIPLEDAE